jgi:FixJ family two-component response regulator
MNTQKPTIFIVDDDFDVRSAIARLLSTAHYEIRTFNSAQNFIAHHNPEPPGCIILDVAMPGLTGLQLQEFLATAGNPRPIIFLTGVGDVPTSVRAMKAGAVNFLTKPVEDHELFAAIDEALRVDQLERRLRQRRQVVVKRLADLTPREREVMEHVIAGQLNKQIAADLGTVEKTIKAHRARVMHKMGARSVAELVQLASCAGVVITPPLRAPVQNELQRRRV